MRRTITLLFCVLAIVALALPAAARDQGAARYVVTLEDSAHPGAVASEHARAHGAAVGHVYSSALKGYSAVIPAHRVDDIARDERVVSVLPDQEMNALHHRSGHSKGGDDGGGGGTEPDPAACPGTQQVPWGIARIGSEVNSTAAGNCSGTTSGVTIYVIDTGIDASHGDLNVVSHVNFASGPNKDCNGHGTHVAGTAAARDNTSDVVGAAPGAALVGVKVLSCNGSGWVSDVIAGIDWVTRNASGASVANMSLGGGAYAPLDDAVRRSVTSGVAYALAAGNSGANACNYSPARVGASLSGAITVGATDAADVDPSWSNHGSCVELWAPGVGVSSTANGGGTTTMSGTSMASPHVAAGLALAAAAGADVASAESQLRSSAQSTGTLANDGAPISLLGLSGF